MKVYDSLRRFWCHPELAGESADGLALSPARQDAVPLIERVAQTALSLPPLAFDSDGLHTPLVEDLSHPLARQLEALAYLVQRQLLLVKANDLPIALASGELDLGVAPGGGLTHSPMASVLLSAARHTVARPCG